MARRASINIIAKPTAALPDWTTDGLTDSVADVIQPRLTGTAVSLIGILVEPLPDDELDIHLSCDVDEDWLFDREKDGDQDFEEALEGLFERVLLGSAIHSPFGAFEAEDTTDKVPQYLHDPVNNTYSVNPAYQEPTTAP